MTTAMQPSRSGQAELVQLSDLLLPFAIRSLATLGVADVLAAGPAPVESIAEAVGANTDALYRTLRFTAGRGVFTQLPDRVFALSPSAEYLRSDRPGNIRPRLMIDGGTESQLRILTEAVHTLRTGEPAYHKVLGVNPFEVMATDRAKAARFHKMQEQVLRAIAKDVNSTVDFSADQLVADVGGGTGTLVGSIVAEHPQLTGLLLDLPAVVAEAPPVLAELGVSDRCELVSGDMFQAVPAGADTYLLSNVLHDWPDDKALAILRNIRAGLGDQARLLTIEALIGDNPSQSARVLWQDFMMMIQGGGRERTAGEHEALLDQAGLRLVSVTPAGTGGTGHSILESRLKAS